MIRTVSNESGFDEAVDVQVVARRGLAAVLRSSLQFQLVRFILVGGLNTVFGYSVYALLIFLNLHYSLAVTLATIAGVIFNFHTTGTMVFRNARRNLLGKFALVYAIVLGFNVGLLWVLHDVAGLGVLVSQAICLPVVVVTAYILQKFFVFRKRDRNHG